MAGERSRPHVIDSGQLGLDPLNAFANLIEAFLGHRSSARGVGISECCKYYSDGPGTVAFDDV